MGRAIVVIPAKSFSRRVPGKNMKPFCGIPLLGWAIIQSVNSHEVAETWVTTDSEEIMEYATEMGAQPFKRQYKDTDATEGSVPMLEIANSLYRSELIKLDDCIVTRFCTTPTLLPHDTDESIRMYWRARADLGVPGVGCHSEFRTLITSRRLARYDKGAIVKGHPVEYHCHNNYRIARHLAFLGPASVRSFVGLPPEREEPDFGVSYRFHEWQMQDCDTPEEFEFAERVMDHYILKGRGREVYDDYGREK